LLAWAVLANIGPWSFLYGPCFARSVLPQLQANIPHYKVNKKLPTDDSFVLVCRMFRVGSKGRVQGVCPPPPEMKPSSHLHLKFVYLTNQLHQSLVVHPLLRKILDLPLMFGTYLNVTLYMYMQVPKRLLKLNGRVPCLYAQHHGFYSCYWGVCQSSRELHQCINFIKSKLKTHLFKLILGVVVVIYVCISLINLNNIPFN